MLERSVRGEQSQYDRRPIEPESVAHQLCPCTSRSVNLVRALWTSQCPIVSISCAAVIFGGSSATGRRLKELAPLWSLRSRRVATGMDGASGDVSYEGFSQRNRNGRRD